MSSMSITLLRFMAPVVATCTDQTMTVVNPEPFRSAITAVPPE